MPPTRSSKSGVMKPTSLSRAALREKGRRKLRAAVYRYKGITS
ncbi:hypothetical protein [uncultured Gimesia sp.]